MKFSHRIAKWCLAVFILCAGCKVERPDDWVVEPSDMSLETRWEWKHLRNGEDYRELSLSEFAAFQARLTQSSCVEVTARDAIKRPSVKTARYFVLRAAENPTVSKRSNDYWVVGGVLSHSDFVSVRKSAVIVATDTRPKAVYMGYTINE